MLPKNPVLEKFLLKCARFGISLAVEFELFRMVMSTKIVVSYKKVLFELGIGPILV